MAKIMPVEGYDGSSTASHTNLTSYADSDDFAIFSYDDLMDRRRMSPVFVEILHSKAVVSHEFISGFEHAAFVWDMQTFMKCFSKGITYAITNCIGMDVSSRYQTEGEINTLYHFLCKNPLKMDQDDLNNPDYQSFNQEDWCFFTQTNSASLKNCYDYAINRIYRMIAFLGLKITGIVNSLLQPWAWPMIIW